MLTTPKTLAWTFLLVGCAPRAHGPSDPPLRPSAEATVMPADTAVVSTQPTTSAAAASDVPVTPIVELPPAEHATAESLAAADPRFEEIAKLTANKEWKRARRSLDPLLAAMKPDARLDLWASATSLAAGLASRDNDARVAKTRYTAVLDTLKDSNASMKLIVDEAKGAPETERNARLGRALQALGEAHFFKAEELRLASEKLAFPKFRGQPTREAIQTYIKKDVTPWAVARRAAIDKAELGYLEVVNIAPVPPPRWVMASAERVGTMWHTFVDDMTKIPSPDGWSPDFVEAYREALSDASAPFEQKAVAAFRTCVGLSEKFRMTDEHARRCQAGVPAPNP